jgi:type IV secretion system protein VirB4
MSDKIFKGATRPAVLLGVPMVPLIAVEGILFLVAMWCYVLASGFAALCVAIGGVMMFYYMKSETKEDDQRLHQMGLKFFMHWRAIFGGNKDYWKARSSSPTDFRRQQKTELTSLHRAAQEARDSDRIPMRRNVRPDVQITKDEDYLVTWHLEGLAFEGLSVSRERAELNNLNTVIQSLSNGRYAFWVHRIRRTQEDTLTTPGTAFAKQLATNYYKRLGSMALTELYLTLVFRPSQVDAVTRMRRNESDVADKRGVDLEVLDTACKLIESSLNAYRPTRLSEYESEGHTFNRQRELFNYLINLRWTKVSAKDVPLDGYLPDTRKLFGNELIEARGTKGRRHGAFLDIKDYADNTEPGILNSLLKLSGEFIETHSFSPLIRLDAAASLKRRMRQLESSEDDSPTQRADMLNALDELTSGRFALGEYHYSLLVIGETADEVRKQRSDAADALQKCGFKAVPIDIVPDAAFWAQLPGNWRYRPRVAQLSSRNFVGMATLHTYNSGKREGNPWGEAVTILRTASGQPYYFNFHRTLPHKNAFGDKALGSTQVIGQSGEGKTVTVAFLVANLLKFGTSWVWFDMNHSAEIFIRALGGRYSTLEPGVPTGFAPFKREPTKKEVLHWIDLMMMCGKPANRELTTDEEIRIEHAVNAVAKFETDDRSIGAVLQNLSKGDNDEIYSRIERWAASSEGTYAWALDNESDDVVMGDGLPQGFDYTELLGQAGVHPVIMANLMYRTEEVIDGRRFTFIMEEYWQALENPYFMKFAKTKQKVIRKQNGFGIYLTQSPSDTLASPIAKALIEQTATFIFLPNPAADEKEYIDGFKLTAAEFAIIKNLPEGQNIMMIKQGRSIAVVKLDLSGMREELLVLGGSDDSVERLGQLRERLGDDPKTWLPAFWRGES